MKVTIAMPVYNGERFIREALDSLLAQTFTDFELIVSDNASTDSTPDICREYQERDARIKYIRQPENRGAFVNAEMAVRAGSGEYTMMVGDDDVYDRRYIEILVPMLERDPDVGLAYSNYGFIDERGVKTPSTLRTFFQRDQSAASVFARYDRHRICLPMIMGLMRSDLFKNALPFQAFDKTTGDLDNLLILRFLSFGKRVDSTREVLFHYRMKDRGGAARPPDWPKTLWGQRVKLFFHHFEFMKRTFAIVDRSAFRPRQRLMLKWRAIETLVAYSTVLPLLIALRERRAR